MNSERLPLGVVIRRAKPSCKRRHGRGFAGLIDGDAERPMFCSCTQKKLWTKEQVEEAKRPPALKAQATGAKLGEAKQADSAGAGGG